MKGDLKKRFLDILFEQDPEDEEYSEQKQIKEEKKETVKENRRSEKGSSTCKKGCSASG